MYSKSLLAAGVAALAVLGGASAASANNTIYAIDDSTNSLVTINPEAATVTQVGSTGVGSGDFGDLTYDSNHGVAYWSAGRGNGNLYTVNLATGAASLVGGTGVNDMFALAYDTGNNTLYGMATNSTTYTINTSTGAATALGGNGGIYPGGMTYNAALDTLFALSAGPGTFYTINASTGAGTLFSNGAGFIDDDGVAWDASRGMFLADDYQGNLYSYDATGNSRTHVLSYGNHLDGIIAVGDASPGVPEPASWALMLMGFGGLGAALRSRRKPVAATA